MTNIVRVSELPEPEDLPSHVHNKLEPDTRVPAPCLRPSVDRSAETVRPPSASPKVVVADPKPPCSDDSVVPAFPAAPRVPVIPGR